MSTSSPCDQGVVAVVPDHGRLLVIRRSQFVIAPRAYCFPGGGVHPGESEDAAVAREMQEELGVRSVPLKLVWRSVTPWHVRLSWWLTDIAAGQQLQPNPQEVEAVVWLTPAEMRATPELLESNLHFLDAWDRNEFHLNS